MTTPSSAPPTQTTVGGAYAGGLGGDDGSGNGKGPLSFTGADTADLLIASAAALAAGRTLFWLAARRENNEEAVSPPAPDAT